MTCTSPRASTKQGDKISECQEGEGSWCSGGGLELSGGEDARVAQSVERPTLAQVVISHSVSLSHASGSVLTARSLEPALDSVSPSLPLPCSHTHTLTLSLSLVNKHYKNVFNNKK